MATKITDQGFEIISMRRVVDEWNEDGTPVEEVVELELRTPAGDRSGGRARDFNANIRIPKDKVPGLFDRVTATFMREAEATE